MPRQKRRPAGGKAKKKFKKTKDKQHNSKRKNKNKNVYSAKRIEKEVNEIRMLIAKNEGESAMKRMNDIEEALTQENKTLPLILNSLKCVILAQYDEHDALQLVFDEIVTHIKSAHYEWDMDSLNCLQNACTRGGDIHYLMIFLESAFNCNTAGVQNTEEISRALYVAYFINAQFDKLSQLSQKMKRTFKHRSDEYTMWSIMGPLIKIILNHFHYKYEERDVEKLSSQLNQTEDTILKLQQFQFERQFINNENGNDLLMVIYYKILKLRKEWKKLFECIDCNDKNKLKLWKLECLVHLNEYDQIEKLCASLLFESDSLFMDDYEIWSHWMDAQLVAIETCDKERVMQQIQDIQMKSAYDKLRAPYLAEIEFNVRWRSAELKSSKSDNDNGDVLSGLMLKYFKHFASRHSCCFDDMKKYLNDYKTKEVASLSLLDSMRDYVAAQPLLKNKVCYHQIELYIGLWTKETENELIKRVQNLYHEWQINIYHDVINKTIETDAADALLLIAVHILLYLAHKNNAKARHFILNAIFLLELGIIRSSASFRLKLYLLRLYCHPCIGNIFGGFKQFESMKIRGVQHDSLSHILYHDSSRYGFLSKTEFFHHQLQEHRREFNIANLARVPQCFKFNNYHKAIEFAEFYYVMKQSEMYQISQSENIVNELVNYYYKKQNDNYSFVDYFEAFILPKHGYLKRVYLENDEHKSQYEWHCEKWIDLNDYTTIPIYINKDEESYNDYYHGLLVCPPVSTLSPSANTNPLLKASHIKLLLSFAAILYKSLQLTSKSENKQLIQLWNLLAALKFVQCDSLQLPLNDIPKILSLCDGRNYHWILVFCFHTLNMQLFDNTDDENKTFTANLSLVCDRFGVMTDDLQRMLESEVNKHSRYGLNGTHLQALWRYISILCLTATSLFRHWIAQTQNKIIMNQYQLISKRMDKLKRSLSDIVEGIQSEYKIIDIESEEKELDKIVKHYEINELLLHQSVVDLEKENKTKLTDIKIALININNTVIRNNAHILKQNILMLKQLRFAV